MKIDRIRMDIDKKLAGVIPSVQWDSNTRFLHINILNGAKAFDLTGCSVKVAGLKPDGTSFLNNVKIINAKEGFIEVVLTEQMNAAAGSVRCDIKIYNSKGVLSTQPFIIDVTPSVTTKNITSSDEFLTLTEALNKVGAIDTKFDNLTADSVAKATEKEIQKHIAQGTMANLTIAPGSISKEKLDPNMTLDVKDGSVTFSKLHPSLFSSDARITVVTTITSQNRLRYMIQFKNNGERLKTVHIKWGVTLKSGKLSNTTDIRCQLYGNTTDNLDSSNYQTIDLNSPIVKITALGEMFINEHTYVISDTNTNKNPQYTIISLEIHELAAGTSYDIDILPLVIEINGKTPSVHKHQPYKHDAVNPVVSGGYPSLGLVTRTDVVSLVKESKTFVESNSLAGTVQDIIANTLDNTKLPLVKYQGSTKDGNGLFIVYMFDIRQLLDTDIEYIKTHPLTIQFTSKNRTNTSGIGCQLFNNNNSSPSAITGGQMYASPKTVLVPADASYLFTRTYEGLSGADRYIRVCLNFKWVTQNALQTGDILDMLVSIGDKDLSPFLVDVVGLPHNSGGQEIVKVQGKTYATTAYVDDKYRELNDKIGTMGGGTGSGPASKWMSKKWCAIGDSITERNFRATKNYHDYIKEVINCTVYNRGISGSGYQASNAIMNRISTFEADSDLLTFFAGTNDYNHGTVPLGKVGDITKDTLCGCIYLSFKGVLERFPTKTIAVFTPLARSSCYGLKEVANSRGYTLGQLADCIKEIAHRFGFPVLDLYRESNLHPWITANNTMYFAYQNDGVSAGDGLHLNDKGQKIIADKILAFINSL